MNSTTLDAILPQPVSQWYDTIVDVPCDLIRPDAENLRVDFDEGDLIDLGNNITLLASWMKSQCSPS